MADPVAIGSAFCTHYYGLFDTNRAALVSLYQTNSMLTFEGKQVLGAAGIMQHLSSLPFQQIRHETVTIDAQPTLSGGILVFVSGNLYVDGGQTPIKFSQVFQLLPFEGASGYWVYNDMFRLNYG
eukprot:TRINITY_DN349_c0_g1_i1.p1 TRINITY_DN349_c0_g1~~TRINITY_DN349_c0_g1_i1.p1  ORF type:complete len:142 (+),score=18.93 TRINITY_DN349_c0_g1_i1:54-428(+)